MCQEFRREINRYSFQLEGIMNGVFLTFLGLLPRLGASFVSHPKKVRRQISGVISCHSKFNLFPDLVKKLAHTFFGHFP